MPMSVEFHSSAAPDVVCRTIAEAVMRSQTMHGPAGLPAAIEGNPFEVTGSQYGKDPPPIATCRVVRSRDGGSDILATIGFGFWHPAGLVAFFFLLAALSMLSNAVVGSAVLLVAVGAACYSVYRERNISLADDDVRCLERDLREAIESPGKRAPDPVETVLGLSKAYVELGDKAGAIEVLEMGLREHSDYRLRKAIDTMKKTIGARP
jgi:hypothetical protein